MYQRLLSKSSKPLSVSDMSLKLLRLLWSFPPASAMFLRQGYSFIGDESIQCYNTCSTCSGPLSDQCTTCISGYWLNWDSACLSNCTNIQLREVTGDFQVCHFPCQTSQYLLWNGTCSNTCSYPLLASIYLGTYNLCNKPCADGSSFYYQNGSCLSTCSAPLIQQSQNNISTCQVPCQTNQYLYYNGSCLTSCTYPFIQQIQSNVSTCQKPCQTNQYLYYNTSCLPNCSSPFTQKIQYNVSTCQKPCQTNEYLYYNGLCLTSCTYPLIQQVQTNISICQKPCQTNEYLYSNNSCLSSCKSPFIQQVISNVTTCQEPCQTNQYFYYNGSCLGSCDYKFSKTQTVGIKTCSLPCTNSSDFYYAKTNQTCIPSCDSPFTSQTVENVSLCLYCEANQFYYNNSCFNECRYPLTQDTQNSKLICRTPCTNSSDFYYADTSKTCEPDCNSTYTQTTVQNISLCLHSSATTGTSTEVKTSKGGAINSMLTTSSKVIKAGLLSICIISPSDPSAFLSATLAKMLQYIRYMRINYPPKLQMMLQTQSANPISLNFGSDIPTSFKDYFRVYPLADVFERYDLPSSFIVNLWNTIITLTITFVALLVVYIIPIVTGKIKKLTFLKVACLKIESLVKWNLLLTLLYSNFDDIVFFSSLQLSTLHYDPPSSLLSSLACFIICVLATLMIFKTLFIIIDIRRANRRVFNVVDPSQVKAISRDKWKKYSILYLSFKDETFSQQAYVLFFLLRICTFYCTIGYLYAYPLIESVLNLLISIMMLLYLSKKRPFKESLRLVEMLLSEAIVAVVNLSVLGIELIESMNKEAEGARIFFGDVIIGSNVMFNSSVMLFFLLKASIMLIEIVRLVRKLRAQGIHSWRQILMKVVESQDLIGENFHLKEQEQIELRPIPVKSDQKADMHIEQVALKATKQTSILNYESNGLSKSITIHTHNKDINKIDHDDISRNISAQRYNVLESPSSRLNPGSLMSLYSPGLTPTSSNDNRKLLHERVISEAGSPIKLHLHDSIYREVRLKDASIHDQSRFLDSPKSQNPPENRDLLDSGRPLYYSNLLSNLDSRRRQMGLHLRSNMSPRSLNEVEGSQKDARPNMSSYFRSKVHQ